MDLTNIDVRYWRRMLRSYEIQADQAARDCQTSEQRLREAERAISDVQAILRAAGEVV